MSVVKQKKNGKLVTKRTDVSAGDVVTLVKLDGSVVAENAKVTVVSFCSTGGFNYKTSDGSVGVVKPLSAWAVVSFGPDSPEYWPPKPGDVWATSAGTEYYIGSNCIVAPHVKKDGGNTGLYGLEDLEDLWKKYGYAVTLKHRKGVKEAV